jgi:hypothetical protein
MATLEVGLASVFALLGAAACAQNPPPSVLPSSSPTSTASPRTEDATARTRWESCYGTFSPAGDAPGDLSRLVRDCGPTGGMRAITVVRSGEQSEDDAIDRYTFEVPSSGHCYRVYAAGDGAVKDLDLLLRGPSGNAVASDLTHDSWPVLPARHPACLSEPGLYMLEVSVFKGSGHYALQVWGR